MSYVALVPLKVQKLGPDGKPIRDARGMPILEDRQPGDPVPEAVTWPNAAIYEKRGQIERDKGVPMPRYRAVKPEFVKTQPPARAPEKVAPPVAKRTKKAAAPVEPPARTPPPVASSADVAAKELGELLELDKKDLVDLARDLGVTHVAKANKDTIAHAILSKRGTAA